MFKLKLSGCQHCGEDNGKEKLYIVDGRKERLCQFCAEFSAAICPVCHNRTFRFSASYCISKHGFICQKCAKRLMKECKSCTEGCKIRKTANGKLSNRSWFQWKRQYGVKELLNKIV